MVTDGLYLKNVTIDKSWNSGIKGTLMKNDVPYEYGHPLQKQIGYQGCASRAICFAACRDITCDNVTVGMVGSTHGWVCGIDSINDSTISSFKNVQVNHASTFGRVLLAETNDAHNPKPLIEKSQNTPPLDDVNNNNGRNGGNIVNIFNGGCGGAGGRI